jgi:NAD(P)-dependent dehydrogenase (short-subunit alcohol dehydrogenase family)
MVAAGRGSTMNVSSISGLVGVPDVPQASYAASKLGLSGLTAELAVKWGAAFDLGEHACPGVLRSEITGVLYDHERSLAWLRRNAPLPGDGTVDDFAGAVL